jgi:hypothetical protein
MNTDNMGVKRFICWSGIFQEPLETQFERWCRENPGKEIISTRWTGDSLLVMYKKDEMDIKAEKIDDVDREKKMVINGIVFAIGAAVAVIATHYIGTVLL